MKTFAFNLLPQKSRSLINKEEKRDNYTVLVSIFPFMAVIIWLFLSLADGLVIERYKQAWESTVNDRKNTIENELAPILIKHGELVQKTNALNNVISKDIKPEQLFILLDTIYSNQDNTFSVVGYGRNKTGSYFVNIKTQNYLRFAEIARRFSAYKYINDVIIDRASFTQEDNSVNGSISFFFNYTAIENATTTTTTK